FTDGRRLTSPRRVEFEGADHPLVFFHFSNLHRPADEGQRKIAVPLRAPDPEHAGESSRVLLKDYPVLQGLFEEYDHKVGAFDGAGKQVGAVPEARPRRGVPPLIRVLLGEALRRGMPFERDPYSLSGARVAGSCALFLLRRLRWVDAKLFVSSQLRFARAALSTHLLQFHR
ncbi:MAG: hypothetical protein ACREUE_08695, partial [Panacagrimonas sp.]